MSFIGKLAFTVARQFALRAAGVEAGVPTRRLRMQDQTVTRRPSEFTTAHLAPHLLAIEQVVKLLDASGT